MKIRVLALASATLGLVPLPRATATDLGLPSVPSGHRPGPDALYLDPPSAPQLENTGPWEADPILVSGAVAYSAGEFIYQDFIYDDHGAAGVPDPNSPFGAGDHLFSPAAGTYTYPTDPVFASNAADLVEFRVKPLETETAFRVTLNTMLDPEAAAFTIAIDGARGPLPILRAWPHGAGVSSPADLFLTVHGGHAELLSAETGAPLSPSPTVAIDTARRQIDVRLPHATWNPSDSSHRMTIGVGLWDAEANSYLKPSIGSATATTPGGAAPTQPAIVNVGPRLDEPMPDLGQVPTYTLGDAAAGAAVQAHWWRDRKQADALRLGDVTGFAATVDFAKLYDEVEDASLVPSEGPINRILASRYAFGQGLDRSKVCYEIGGVNEGRNCIGRLVGQLQPYALYVPPGAPPAEGWGMTLLLHSLSANQNQYSASRNQAQLGARGGGNLVVTPSGRGPDGFYAGVAEADTFETWADVARRYPVNPDRAIVSGYSMGGYGTYRLLARYPDLFSAGFSVVGIPGSADPMIASLRNTPVITWNAVADELVNIRSTEDALTRLTAAGLRVTSWLFPTADHLTLATNDEYQPGVDMLEVIDVDRDPAHVTFVVNPAQDNAGFDVVADHAYWVSDIALSDPSKPGRVDVRSGGFGVGDPAVIPTVTSAGALLGGHHGPMPYVSRSQTWGAAPTEPVSDVLTIDATNIASITVDPVRARVTCDAVILVNAPVAVTLTGC